MSKTLALSFMVGATLSREYFSVFDNAKKRINKLGTAFDAHDKKLQAANGVIKYKERLQMLKQKQDQAGGSNKKLADGIKVTERLYKQAKSSAKSYGVEIGSVIQQQKKLGAETDRLKGKLARLNQAQSRKDKAGQKLQNMRGQMLGSAGTFYTGARTIGKAFELEDKTLQLGDVITGENIGVRLAESVQHAKDFARKSLASEAEILEIDYSLRSTGLDDKAAQKGSEIVSKVVTVTKGEASNVGFIIGDTFNVMGDKMVGSTEDKLARIGDVYTKTKNLYSIKDFNQLGEGLKEGISAAVSNNVSLEQTSAIIGQINNGMLKGSQAGTGFSAMLRQLPKASEKLGFTIVRNDKGEMDVIKTLENVESKLALIRDPDQKAMLIQELFGDEGKKALVPLINDIDSLKKNYEEVQNASDGVLDEAYQRRISSASGQWLMLKQNFISIGTSIAQSVLPSLNSILTPLASFAGWISKGVEKYPALGKALFGVTLGFSVFAAGLALVTAGMWAFNTALLANPITWVIGGIILGAALIIAFWKPITNFFKGLWQQVKTAFDGGIVGIGKLIINWSPYGLFYKAMSKVLNWFGFDLPSNFTEFGGNLIGSFIGGAKSVFSSVSGFFKGLWTDIKSNFNGGILGISETILNWSPVGLFYKAFESVFSWFGVELPSTFTEFGGGLIDGISSGLTNMIPDLMNKVSSIGSSITSWFNDTFGFSIFSDKPQKLELQVETTFGESANHLTAEMNALADKSQSRVSADTVAQAARVAQATKVNQALRASATVKQQNNIQVTVNNPTSNVDVANGVADGMARQGGSVPFTDMAYD